MSTQADIARVRAILSEMEKEAAIVNAILEPLPKRDEGNRQEPLWNAHSLSGALIDHIRRIRGWLILAEWGL